MSSHAAVINTLLAFVLFCFFLTLCQNFETGLFNCVNKFPNEACLIPEPGVASSLEQFGETPWLPSHTPLPLSIFSSSLKPVAPWSLPDPPPHTSRLTCK